MTYYSYLRKIMRVRKTIFIYLLMSLGRIHPRRLSCLEILTSESRGRTVVRSLTLLNSTNELVSLYLTDDLLPSRFMVDSGTLMNVFFPVIMNDHKERMKLYLYIKEKKRRD